MLIVAPGSGPLLQPPCPAHHRAGQCVARRLRSSTRDCPTRRRRPTTGCHRTRHRSRRCCSPSRASSSPKRLADNREFSDAGPTGKTTWTPAGPDGARPRARQRAEPPSRSASDSSVRRALLTELYAGTRPSPPKRNGRARRVHHRSRHARSAEAGTPSRRTCGGARRRALGGWQVARNLFFLVVLTGAIGERGRDDLDNDEQVRADAPNAAPGLRSAGTSCLSAGVPARASRDGLPAAPHPEGQRGKLGGLLHPRLQPGVDEPRRHRRGWRCCSDDEARWPARRAHAGVERDRQYADYVLPMGLGPERHDLMSQETHAGAVDRLPPAGRARALGAAGETRRARRARRTRRGVGGGRVLDRAVVAHRPGRRSRHP